VSVVYDAGVLVAADRNDRRVWADHRARLEQGVVPVTTAPVVAQVSRSLRQAQLHRFLRGCEVAPFSPSEAHDVGKLLAGTGARDVVDAHIVLKASRLGATLITSDPRDVRALANGLPGGVRVETV
jgi:predicted nucleic acid-binding protein